VGVRWKSVLGWKVSAEIEIVMDVLEILFLTYKTAK